MSVVVSIFKVLLPFSKSFGHHKREQKIKKILCRSILASIDGSLGTLDALPRDVILYLLSNFFQPSELMVLFLVSKKMNWMASNDYVWKRIFERECNTISIMRLKQSSTEAYKHMEVQKYNSWKEIFRDERVWKWDSKCCSCISAGDGNNKKGPIEVTKDGLTVERPHQWGSNPAIVTTQPLTRIRNSYEVVIKKRGAWIGIGLADKKFKLHNSSTLGTQSGCINSSFFCQDSTLLQMQGCKHGIYRPKKIQLNDRIRVVVNFNENTVLYYRNGLLEGQLHSETPLLEGKLFPCINLSFGCVVTLVHSGTLVQHDGTKYLLQEKSQ